MGRQAKTVRVSTHEAQLVNQIIRQPTKAQWLVTRSKIIMGAAAGKSISQQSRELGLVRNAVQHWREKWESQQEARQSGEESGQLAETIEQLLRDEYRSGAPATFPQSKWCKSSRWPVKNQKPAAIRSVTGRRRK